MVFIPILAIHHDSDIDPNPEVFDPENFSKAAVRVRNSMSYIPFGDGPRNWYIFIYIVYIVCKDKIFLATNQLFLIDLCTLIMNLKFKFWEGNVCKFFDKF